MTSRRDFLKRLFMAGAAVAVVPAVLLEAPKPVVVGPFMQWFIDAWSRLSGRAALRTIDNDDIAFVPPAVAVNILADCQLLDPSYYSHAKMLFKGEIGAFYGVRLVVEENPFQEATAYRHDIPDFHATPSPVARFNAAFERMERGAEAWLELADKV